jgi:hypothetical protein
MLNLVIDEMEKLYNDMISQQSHIAILFHLLQERQNQRDKPVTRLNSPSFRPTPEN